MSADDLENARRSLRLIFWGILVVAIEIRITNFDLLNNILGYAIIGMGVIGLAKLPLGNRYGSLMKFVATTSFLDAFIAPFREGPHEISPTVKIISAVFGIFTAGAAFGFSIAMQRLCETASLDHAARSWRANRRYWIIASPAVVGATWLAAWLDESFSIPIAPIPILVVLFYVLFLPTGLVWIHFLICSSRTIAGLKKLEEQYPAPSTVRSAEPPVFQFRIRSLMLVTAATAVIAAGVSQGTIPYWQFTMAGLVGVSLLATWLEHRALGKGLLVAVAIVLVAGYTQLTTHGQFGPICGTNAYSGYSDADFQLSDSFLADIDGWLASKGYEKSPPPAASYGLSDRFSPYNGLPFAPEPKTAIWYRGTASKSQGVTIRVLYSKAGQYLHFVTVEYDWDVVDFPWIAQQREKDLKQFIKETAGRWQEYLERQRKVHSKP